MPQVHDGAASSWPLGLPGRRPPLYFALSLFSIAQGGGHLSAPADHVLDLQMAISGSNLVRHIPGTLSPEFFAVRIDAVLVYLHALTTPSPSRSRLMSISCKKIRFHPLS